LIIGTIPGAVLGFLFEKQAETVFRSPWILCATLSLMGLLLFFSDKVGGKSKSLADLHWGSALAIGFCQGLAIIPGISRSGITITAGLLLGLSRTDAVRFSFYMAIPITAGAGLLKADYLFHNAGDPVIWSALFTSAISGAAAIHVLLNYVKTKSFTPFVVYRFVLAGGVLVWLLAR
jgi:undecaprenyl-diphosphatase